ncbi:MAG: hypothetical protein HOP10_11660 [Chitinophagaceae bacterium]|nr:hypothetical protein [Chitinophagaceae bacterium]
MQKEKIDLIVSIVSASLFVLLLVVSIFMLFRIYVKRKNKLLLEKEILSIQFEQTLLQSKLEIQEETFTYISREIHDNIGQTLSMARLNLNSMEMPGQQEKMELIDNLMEKSIADLRNLSHSLDTDRIRKYGWLGEVLTMLEMLKKSGKYEVHIETDNQLPVLGKDKPIILFRMIQEIINNIIKHAGATKINFKASHKNATIILEIRDNGKGFDKNTMTAGSGLNNLLSRSAMINATIDINSQPGLGTQLIISVHDEVYG